ncbi:MAG: NAD(+) kinase [Gammaproteobacteria bacterium]|nr:NAD(+) kinase [Gammaproteobacteria bacterium]
MEHSSFKTAGLFGKYADSSMADTLARLARHLLGRKIKVVIESSTAELITKAGFDLDQYSTEALDVIGQHIDVGIVIGGDGTFLNIARNLAADQVPLIGVNLGRVGFLADISVDDMIPEINRILDGDHETERRSLLHAEVMRSGKIIHAAKAFNDVIINKGELARLIEFETFIDGEFVNSMRADGIIVATPTGSTAYALSAGGPILHPALEAIELVPICPHTLSDRPIVVNNQCVVEIVMTSLSNQHAYLTLDGQAMFSLQDHDHIFVRRNPELITLLRPSGRNHYSVLRAKLHWGEKL